MTQQDPKLSPLARFYPNRLSIARIVAWTVAIALTGSIIFLPLNTVWAAPVKTSNLQAQLVSEVKTIQPGVPFWIALRLKIRSGWHVYWKNPGDSGAVPTINWTLPSGLKAGELVFPYPERLPIGPLMNFGYKDEVSFLIEMTSPSWKVYRGDSLPGTLSAAKLPTTSPVTLRAKADLLVCKVECIPEEAQLELTLPVTTSPTADNTWADAFSRTRQAVPQPLPWQAMFMLDANDLTLRVNAPELQAGQVEEVQFFPYKDGVIRNAAPQKVTFGNDGLILKVERGYQETLNTVDGVLVVREKLQSTAQAFTMQAQPGEAISTSNSASTSPEQSSIWQTLLLALLGGMILNLMPCVFPVLSLKVLNIAQKSQQSLRQARLHGLVFTGGVLASFAIVAGVLIALRALGQQVGWGFQLQSPVFVLLMVYVLFAVGLSLSGIFMIGASIMGLGHGLASRSGLTGEFFTGVLATVMATPCTAPFMATAVGVALTQSAPVAIAILLTLGFGLALPYLIISFTPALRYFLPKPGAWMETFQQLLAFPMYGATAWLLWVLTQQAGANGLAVALGGMLLIGFAAWLQQKTQMAGILWRRVGSVGAMGAIVLALTLTPLVGNVPLPTAQADGQSASQGLMWKPYTVESLKELRQSSQPVFINFTASWCITCLVNERVALSQPEVMAAFQEKGITLVKADWTNRNATITEALTKFGRSGVPLYLLYPAGLEQSQPIILPQVLTPAAVKDALETVSIQSSSL